MEARVLQELKIEPGRERPRDRHRQRVPDRVAGEPGRAGDQRRDQSRLHGRGNGKARAAGMDGVTLAVGDGPAAGRRQLRRDRAHRLDADPSRCLRGAASVGGAAVRRGRRGAGHDGAAGATGGAWFRDRGRSVRDRDRPLAQRRHAGAVPVLIRQLRAADLARWLADPQRPAPVLVDVREPWSTRTAGSRLGVVAALRAGRATASCPGAAVGGGVPS